MILLKKVYNKKIIIKRNENESKTPNYATDVFILFVQVYNNILKAHRIGENTLKKYIIFNLSNELFLLQLYVTL